MSMRKICSRVALSAMVVGTGSLAANRGMADEPQEKKYRVVVVADEEHQHGEEPQVEHIEVKKLHEHLLQEADQKLWLGIMLKDVEGDLARYLGTEEGILVDAVYDESPAAKAGIEEGDILIEANGESMQSPGLLLGVMQGVEKGDKLTLLLLRKGKEVELKVEPAERPAMEELELDIHKNMDIRVDLSDLENVDGSIKDVLNNLRIDGKDLNVFQLGGPALAWTGENGDVNVEVIKQVDGDEVEIKIVREGEEPAKITVIHGEEVKEFVEGGEDEMPAEVADVVKKHLKSAGKRRLQLQLMPESEAFEFEVDEAQIAEKAREMAEKYLKSARSQSQQAREAAERIRTRVSRSSGREVEELRALVEELRSEVKELRSQLRDHDDDNS